MAVRFSAPNLFCFIFLPVALRFSALPLFYLFFLFPPPGGDILSFGLLYIFGRPWPDLYDDVFGSFSRVIHEHTSKMLSMVMFFSSGSIV